MKILYLDESHDTKHYVLAGLLIDDTKYRKFEETIDKVLADNGFGDDEELHAEVMWNRRQGRWKGQSLDDVTPIVKRITDTLKSYAGPKYFVTGMPVTKANDHQKYFELLSKLYPKACQAVSTAGRSNKQLLIIFDTRDDIRGGIFTHTNELKQIISNKKTKKFAVIDYGYEGDSKHSRMLQMSDFIAFFYRKYIEIQKKTDDRLTNLLKEIFENDLKNKVIVVK